MKERARRELVGDEEKDRWEDEKKESGDRS